MTDAQGEPCFLYGDESISRIVRNAPRVTVASVYDPVENSMAFGVAVCSPKDVFKKSIGRSVAEERAKNKPVIKVVGLKRNRIREVSKSYANRLISNYLSKNVQFDI